MATSNSKKHGEVNDFKLMRLKQLKSPHGYLLLIYFNLINKCCVPRSSTSKAEQKYKVKYSYLTWDSNQGGVVFVALNLSRLG